MAAKKPAPAVEAEAPPAVEVRRPNPAESSDPTVHHAMAVLQGALMNRAALDVADADVEAADKAVAAAKKALADLGHE